MSVLGGRLVEEVQGALFDIDGTLLDTMPGFLPGWNITGEEFGLKMSEEVFYGFGGWALPDIIRKWHRDEKGTEASDAFVEEFKAKLLATNAAREAAGELHAPPIACVVDVARAYQAKGVPVCAATSGDRRVVTEHLARAGLSDIFPSDRVVCAQDLPPGRGKPQPDIFLRAAEILKADPARCVAYEDAESGLQAAWAAGCQVVDVRDFPGYPLAPGLKTIMEKQRAARQWLVQAPPAGA